VTASDGIMKQRGGEVSCEQASMTIIGRFRLITFREPPCDAIVGYFFTFL
jgi:hypothetical protein